MQKLDAQRALLLGTEPCEYTREWRKESTPIKVLLRQPYQCRISGSSNVRSSFSASTHPATTDNDVNDCANAQTFVFTILLSTSSNRAAQTRRIRTCKRQIEILPHLAALPGYKTIAYYIHIIHTHTCTHVHMHGHTADTSDTQTVGKDAIACRKNIIKHSDFAYYTHKTCDFMSETCVTLEIQYLYMQQR